MSDLSHSQLWLKFRRIKGLRQLLEKALLLYVLITDADFPNASKVIAVTALAYLVNPFDAIPDVTPIIGYVDDMAIILGVIKKLSGNIQPHHRRQAKQRMNEL